MTGPPISLYDPLPPRQWVNNIWGPFVFEWSKQEVETIPSGQEQDSGTVTIHPDSPDWKRSQEELLSKQENEKWKYTTGTEKR